MAPPSFSPPGYTYDRIPERLVNKALPPEGVDTNTRAYAIFFSYLASCFALTAWLILKLVKNHQILKKSTTARPPPRKHVYYFAALASGSLFTTWGFMFKYFNNSYRTWLMWRSVYEMDPAKKHWGMWLKETSLFHEAWETAIIGNARYWWSHQIFFFACGLGLYLEQRGVRRGIKYTWAFMLLGQIVAISFATNLLLLTLLVSPPPPRPSSTGVHQRKWFGPWLLNLIGVVATEIPAYFLADEHYWFHPTDFMPMLLTPHIALMVLPVVRAIIPEKHFNDDNVDFADKVYKYLWSATILGGGTIFWMVTGMAYSYSGVKGITDALLEHPAVSSVAFDVIFCWVTWISWWRVTSGGVEEVLSAEEDEKKSEWANVGVGTAVSGGEADSGVRRR